MLGVALRHHPAASLSKMHADEPEEEFAPAARLGSAPHPDAHPARRAGPGPASGAAHITTLFYHGAFTAADVFQTRTALVAYGVGLAGLILW